MEKKPIKIKVCGITGSEQAAQLHQMGADYIGFIFYPGSKRFAGIVKLNDPDLSLYSTTAKYTGVFVNPTEAEVKAVLQQIPAISVLQFHGTESPEFCTLFNKKYEIIKAFGVHDLFDAEKETAPYISCVHYFLFDTKSVQHGGTGRSFNWNILAGKQIGLPFFLSGGIKEEDVADLQKFKHPDFYGIDINSCFETAPGIKAMQKVQNFITILKEA